MLLRLFNTVVFGVMAFAISNAKQLTPDGAIIIWTLSILGVIGMAWNGYKLMTSNW